MRKKSIERRRSDIIKKTYNGIIYDEKAYDDLKRARGKSEWAKEKLAKAIREGKVK